MKKTILFIASLLGFLNGTLAQTNNASSRSLLPTMTLTIDRAGGANGAGVVWHPVQKKYYAAQAGNADFPMLIFDAKGKKLSNEELSTGIDVRSFWYNPTNKSLMATTYDNAGWYEYKLDAKGIPTSKKKLTIETTQPDPQSVGAYNPTKKTIYFFDYNTVSIETHDLDGAIGLNKIKIYLGLKSKDDLIDEDQTDAKTNYNDNTVIYTGVPHSEIGLFNFNDKQVELYDLNTGLLTKTLKLPADAPAPSMLDFCYSNGIYWLFDTKARIWHGYK